MILIKTPEQIKNKLKADIATLESHLNKWKEKIANIELSSITYVLDSELEKIIEYSVKRNIYADFLAEIEYCEKNGKGLNQVFSGLYYRMIYFNRYPSKSTSVIANLIHQEKSAGFTAMFDEFLAYV